MSKIHWRSFFLGAVSFGLLLLVLGAAPSVWFAYKAEEQRAQVLEAAARAEAQALELRAKEFQARRQWEKENDAARKR